MADKGYDPKKAAVYNKMRLITDDEAARRAANITDDEEANYVVNDVPGDPNRGNLGPFIAGTGTITQAPTAGLESSNFERVDYPVKANSEPSNKTPITYTTTSTEQVSGGGESTVISGQPQPSAASRALQPSIDAKQAEIDQFTKDNPSNFARSKQGLPPLSPEENAARTAQFRQLSEQKTALKNEQFDAQNPGVTTIIEKPNTTTNTSTTTYGTASTNSAVEAPDSQDEALSQQEEARLDAQPGLVTGGGSTTRTVNVNADGTIVQGSFQETVKAPAAADVVPDQVVGLGNNQIAVLEPAPVDNLQVQPQVAIPLATTDAPAAVNETGDQPLLTPEQSIARAQGVRLDVPTDDPAAAAADFTAQTNQDVRTAIGVKEPAPVDANNTGQQGQSTISGARGGNVQENEQLEAARQAAREAELKQQAAIAAEFQSPASGDWRVTLRLAREANYLYMAEDNPILAPLKASRGVIFPYMPTISTSYNADYDVTDLTHSNYRGNFYKSSYVGDVQLTGVFTAQDTAEANYLLAVIHFFRSVTKMFYGANDPLRGAPPPLVYLSGLGQYQFNNHPCVVKTFNYSLPNDCDYIRTKPNNYNVNLNDRNVKTDTGPTNAISTVINRLRNAALPKGALPNSAPQSLLETQSVYNIDNSTYVPTKCEISISLAPIQTRSQQSQQFSFQDYANGRLLKGGGFW